MLSAAGVTKLVIFYDDVCVMCNGFVNLILRVDRRQQFLFAPLGGEIASKMLPPLSGDPSKWSMVYVDESGIHDQSDASLEVTGARRSMAVVEPGAALPALDSKSGLPRDRSKPISLVWKTRHMPPSFARRESSIPPMTQSKQGLHGRGFLIYRPSRFSCADVMITLSSRSRRSAKLLARLREGPTMESLPNTSEASLSRGFWFVFPLEGKTIRAWGGCTGLERVYVDDGVVSEHRSIGTKSVHVFSIDGDNYAIWFKTIDMLKGQLECTLIKNGEL